MKKLVLIAMAAMLSSPLVSFQGGISSVGPRSVAQEQGGPNCQHWMCKAATAFETYADAAEFNRCDGEAVTTLGGVSIDSGCESGRSFTSHDLGTVCITGNLTLAPGAYRIEGTKCGDGSLEITSARVYYMNR